MKKAIILFSGGLDSTTCYAIAKSQNYACYALTFAYGQKHVVEVSRAKALAKQLGMMEHKVLTLPLDEISGSSLVDADIPVPDYQGKDGIPSTYVPARNTIFLSFALAWAEVIRANDIFLGANCIDYSQYPDCRPDYLNTFAMLAKLATKAGVEGHLFQVHTPLLYLNKAEIIQKGMSLGVDYSQTVSCYRANSQGQACGHCDSCIYRKKGFTEAGVLDPTPYYSV